MDANQNVEPVGTPEYATTTTTVGTCPTCISGTDPILTGKGFDVIQDPE